MAATLGIFGIFLLFSEHSSALTVDILEKEYKVTRGDNAMIPCRFTAPKVGETVQVTWTDVADVPGDPESGIITYTGPTAIKVHSKYKGKVTLIHDIPSGKADLQLQRVTITDTRVYKCRVEVTNNDEDAEFDTATLIVLEPPSPPICKIEGVAKYYKNIKLTCRSSEGKPAPTYRWQRHDNNNVPQPIPPKATDQNGVLSLYSITNETSGFYICTSTNEIRSETCNLTLAVMPLPPSPPICKIEGVAEYYEDIKLTCRSSEGKPAPTYRWQRHDSNNVPQPIPPNATDQNGVLSLYSITKEMSGFYICTSTNEIRSETCNLTLAVMPLNICLKL